MLVHHRFAKYGVQTTFYIALEDITDAEAPFTGVAPLAADIWLSKDGGAAANATNAATAISNGFYSWVATATELQATVLEVSIYDATASAIFKPVFLHIQTKLVLGQVDVDAAQISNGDAIKATGVGSGYGIKLSGATAAFYHNGMDQLEGSEPTGFPSNTASFAAIIQFLKRRWGNKRTQTATTFTQLKDDSSTTCWTATVSDDGTTQTVAKGA